MHQYTLRFTLTAAIWALGIAIAHAQPTTAPTGSAAALPPGHPDIASMPTGAHPALPAGHPDISTMMSGARAASPQLPPGHPDISGHAPATSQPSAIGTLTIRAIQRTHGGPPTSGDAVTIELFHRGQALNRIETHLDDTGTVVLDDVPVSYGVQPVVKVSHGGLEYQTLGQLMDREHPNLQMDVHVYATTEQPPAWRFPARHIMVHPDEHGLHVTEMLIVENPTDRTWRGTEDADGKRATFALPVTPGIAGVQLNSGFDAAKMVDDKLINFGPLMPGRSQYQFGYVVPVTEGKAKITLGTTAEMGHLMVFLPDDGSAVSAHGLQELGVSTTDQGNMRYYKAGPLSAGQQVSLTLSGVRLDAAHEAAPVAASAVTSMLPKVVAGAGGVIVILFGAAFMFIKSPKPARPAHSRR
jgi:hypothetical protein